MTKIYFDNAEAFAWRKRVLAGVSYLVFNLGGPFLQDPCVNEQLKRR